MSETLALRQTDVNVKFYKQIFQGVFFWAPNFAQMGDIDHYQDLLLRK